MVHRPQTAAVLVLPLVSLDRSHANETTTAFVAVCSILGELQLGGAP